MTAGPVPDVVTLQRPDGQRPKQGPAGGLILAEVPPHAWAVRRAEQDLYAARADRLTIHQGLGEVVAVIEIVSPGNKSSQSVLRSFVEKAYELIHRGIHLLVVDLFPPSRLQPRGIHPLIWDHFVEEPFEPPEGKPLTAVSYAAGAVKVA